MNLDDDSFSLDANRNPREGVQWSEGFRGAECGESASTFHDFGPAYDFGLNARRWYPLRDFDDVDCELSSAWAASRRTSILTWEWARHGARAAWSRIRPSPRTCAQSASPSLEV
jgi:hypothetical protein